MRAADKVFRPDPGTVAEPAAAEAGAVARDPGLGAARAAPRSAVPVRVAEVTAERHLEELPELPLHLLGEPGAVAVQLRTTLRRVAVGAGLARRSDLLERVRALPDLPGLVTSPAGGTFIIGGEPWLGMAAIGTPPAGTLPIDWMLGALRGWLDARLAGLGIRLTAGRVEGAWCPGFSDLGAGGRKLAGLGFRSTRDWVVMRGVLAVRPLPDADLEVLRAVHDLIGVEVIGASCVSLAELSGDPSWTVARAIDLLAAGDAPRELR